MLNVAVKEKGVIEQFLDEYTNVFYIDIDEKPFAFKKFHSLLASAVWQSGLTEMELLLIAHCRAYNIFIDVNTYMHRLMSCIDKDNLKSN